MTNKEIESKLLTFNSDPQTKAIRDFYNRKSFFEVLSKSRNENTHSSFLAWLLEYGSTGVKDDSPLIKFLDILIRKADCKENQLPDSLQNLILSRTLSFSKVDTSTEKFVRDLSEIPSKDRLDIFVQCTFSTPLDGKRGLRIVVENKIYSNEVLVTDTKFGFQSGGEMDEGNGTKQGRYPDYYFKNQTQRYYYALAEKPLDTDFYTLFVFLTPIGNKPTDEHYIPVSYQDLMEYLLDPLSQIEMMDPSALLYLKEYMRALSVPSISENDNAYTVLAVSNHERKALKKFWEDYKDLVIEAYNAKNNVALQSFWEKNQPLIQAIYNAEPEVRKDLKAFETTRDYTKYTLSYKNVVIGTHLGKRAVVLAAFKEMVKNGIKIPETDVFNRVFYYKEDEFVAKHAAGEITDDTFKNRYTQVECGGDLYRVGNQWGVGNWDWVEETLSDLRFSIEAE